MIDVNDIYEKVAMLSRKEQNGYHSGEDFNRQVPLVNNLLFDFYFRNYETNQRIPDSLRPFIKEPVLVVNSSGEITLPADYRHRLEVQVGYLLNGSETQYYECPYLPANQEASTMNSLVRRPDASRRRFRHTLKASTIKILPTSFTGVVKLKYLAQPANAVWGSDIDTDNVIEEYDADASTNFEWEPMDETNLVDLFLFLIGVQTRQSELLEWVGQKNVLSKTQI